MAQNMAIELSGSENRHEILHKQYTLALRRARTLEGRQGPAQQYIDDNNSCFVSAHQNYGKV
jgi:predicted oxidoreductase